MVTFDSETDRDNVMSKGPWMIFDHCLLISPWTPTFVTSEAIIEISLVLFQTRL